MCLKPWISNKYCFSNHGKNRYLKYYKIAVLHNKDWFYCLEKLIDFLNHGKITRGYPWWLSSKESACQCRRDGFNPWVRKIPWRRKWQRTPAFLPGESHGQRSLAGYSPRDWRVGHDVVIKQQQQNNQCFIDHFNHLNVHNSGIKHLHPVVQLWWLYNSRTVHHPKS